MPAHRFRLESEFVEVNQLLKLVGLCNTGGEGKHLVAEGLVSVDGAPETRKTAKIRAGQLVECEGHRIQVLGPAPD